MASRKTTVILNEYASSKKRSSRGKKSVSLEFKSEPVVHMFDDEALGREPADAIRDILEEQIKGISTPAKASTIRRREYSRRALASGSAPRTVRERYRGRLPGVSRRLFNDSGRLAEELGVTHRRGEWRTVAPPERLSGYTQKLLNELRNHVSALRQGESLVRDQKFKKALEKSHEQIIMKAKSPKDAKTKLRKLGLLNRAKLAIKKITSRV